MCPRVWILCVLFSILSVSDACTSRRIQIRSRTDPGTTDGEMKMSECSGPNCSVRIENNVNVKVTCRKVSNPPNASAHRFLDMNTKDNVRLIKMEKPSNQTTENNNTITYDHQSKHLTFIIGDVKIPGNYGFAIETDYDNIKADECTVNLVVNCIDEETRAPDKETTRAPDKEPSRDTYNSPVWPGIVTVVLLVVMLCVGAYFFKKRRRNRQMTQHYEAEPCISQPGQESAVCPNCECSLNVDIQISSGPTQ